MNFSDIPIVARETYSVTDSVKINGSPGTGKTTQSFRRYIEALNARGCGLDDTAVVSYRVALARDLLSRLNQLGIVEDYELQNTDGRTELFGTVHGVCRRILGGDLNIVTPTDRADWCSNRNWTYYSDEDDTVGELFFDIVDWLSTNEKTADEASVAPQFDDFSKEFRAIDFNAPMQSWLEYKEENDLYDFHDLFSLVLSNEIVPDVEILVVDEMHDVFPLMHSVIEMWVESVKENGGTVIVAGDTQQVINNYQGADSRFFNDLDLPEITLRKCHKRPPKPHWDVATDILSKSHEPRDITVDVDGTISFIESPTLPAVGINSPQDLLDENAKETDSVMFLARSRAQCRGISNSLRTRGVLFKGSSGTQAWTRRESPTKVAIYHILQELSQFDSSTVEQEGWVADDLTLTVESNLVFRSDDVLKFAEVLPERYIHGDKADFVHEMKSEDRCSIVDIVDWTTAEFWSEITNAEKSLEYLSVNEGLLKWMKPALIQNERSLSNSDNLTVTVQTIHASKGSEADVVILYDGITRKIQDSIYNSVESRANEHRVWYVALTRSRRDLIIARNAYDWAADYISRHTAGGALC